MFVSHCSIAVRTIVGMPDTENDYRKRMVAAFDLADVTWGKSCKGTNLQSEPAEADRAQSSPPAKNSNGGELVPKRIYQISEIVLCKLNIHLNQRDYQMSETIL